jgi:NTE family protein
MTVPWRCGGLMVTNRVIRSRVAAATPWGTFGFPRPGFPAGSGTATAGSPDVPIFPAGGVRPLRGVRYSQATGLEPATRNVSMLLGAELPTRDVVINLFDAHPAGSLETFQLSFLNAAVQAMHAMVASGALPDDVAPDIVRVAASVTPSGFGLRSLFPRPGGGDPLGPDAGGELPGIPSRLKVDLAKWLRGACAGAITQGLAKWGSQMADSTPTYLPVRITGLAPADACAGEHLVINGAGFGDGARRTVAFTAAHQSVVLVAQESIVRWSDIAVEVIVPPEARRGAVGLVQMPASPKPRASADAFLGEISECFGAAVVAQMQRQLQSIWPTIGPPVSQADGVNMFVGGPPMIDYFYVVPQGLLWPRRPITLRYRVVGANSLQIVSRQVGAITNELPPVPGPLDPAGGEVTVTVPGTRPWRGQYVLRAANRCTGAAAIESVLDFEMVFRRGLVLGGGGTRGDFQVGALRYLYDVHGWRPDAIASTSVGSVNAVYLAQGDEQGRSAAEGLAALWLTEMHDEGSMWSQQPWLVNLKKDVRGFINSFSLAGLMLLPYAVVSDKAMFDDAQTQLGKATAFFNMDPIEALMRRYVDTDRVATGIPLLVIAVSLETGSLVAVDNAGGVDAGGIIPPSGSQAPNVAPNVHVVDGVMASAAMPGIFPARPIGGSHCVDGGVREVVPVRAAVERMGCNEVIAIRVSAPPPVLASNFVSSLPSVIARAVLEIAFDEIAESDVHPYHGWGDAVKLTQIQPSFDLHDPMVVEPGLMRIAMDYGWMRAGEMLDFAGDDQPYALSLSDQITALRAQNWRHAHWASVTEYADPFRGLIDFLTTGFLTPCKREVVNIPDPEAVRMIRANCFKIRELLVQRHLVGAPTPGSDITQGWFRNWESIRNPPDPATPWDYLGSQLGYIDAVRPPDPVL